MESAFWPCRLGDQLCREGNLYLLILPVPHPHPPCPPCTSPAHSTALGSPAAPRPWLCTASLGSELWGVRGAVFPLFVLSEGGVSWKDCRELASRQSWDGYLPSEPSGGFPSPSPGLHSGEGCQSSPSLIAALHRDN